MIELVTLNQFKEVKEKGKGYIAITDYNLKSNCIHHVSCHSVTEQYFKQKVISSNRKNGSYYYTADFNEAMNIFEKMCKCLKCF